MTATISIHAGLARKILQAVGKDAVRGESYYIDTDNRGRQWLYAEGLVGAPLAMNRLPLSWHDPEYPFLEFVGIE